MAIKGEISFKSEKMGELEGPRENKTSLVYKFSFEVFLTKEGSESRVQGARRITEFEVVKYVDRITPLLYLAVCQGDLFPEIKITLYRIAEQTGEDEAYFRYLLEDARIVSVLNWMKPQYYPDNEPIGHLEKVKILARKITWTFLDGGIEATEEAY